MKISHLFFVCLSALLPFCGSPQVNQPTNKIDRINGMTLESPPRAIESTAFLPIKNIHANFVSIVPYAFSPKNKPSVIFNHERQWWGEREEGVIDLIKMAKENEMKVMLKPQVWLHEGWVGDFILNSEKEWKEWETAYSSYILFYAQIAQANDVDIYCIGTEYKMAATQRPNYWITLIAKIREIFKGKLTYAANWDEYQQISFWDKIDFIGINAYFPLSQKANPNKNELLSAWQELIPTLEKFSTKYQKPILLTEFGYRSVNYAAGNQWLLDGKAENQALQQLAFQALFEVLWGNEWLAGGFIWKWEFESDAGGDKDLKYTPQGKPALETISKAYSE